MKFTQVVFIVMVVAVLGCSKKATSQDKADGKKNDTVLIEVGEAKITEADLREEKEGLPPQLKALVLTKEGQKEFVDGLVNREMLYLEAKAKGVENDEKFKKEFERFKKRAMVEQYLKNTLAATDKIDDKELQEYFKKNEKQYTAPEKLHLKHIVVDDKKKADELYRKVKKTPKDFENLAMENNIDQSGRQGGELGNVDRNALPAEFQKGLEKVKKPGEISPVIKSQFGYHIIKLAGRVESKSAKFEDVKEEVREAYLREKQKSRFESVISELKKKYQSKVNDSAIDKIMNAETQKPAVKEGDKPSPDDKKPGEAKEPVKDKKENEKKENEKKK